MAKVKTDQRTPIEEVIRRAKALHGDTYDYEQTRYVQGAKIAVLCKIHNEEFFQVSRDHVGGQGCPKCGRKKASKNKTFTQEEFVEKAEAKHPGLYDYSETVYVKASEKVNIRCKKHGSVFSPIAYSLLAGVGCPDCGKEKGIAYHTKNSEEAIRDFSRIHGDRYDYSSTTYVNSKTRMNVICREHGPFTILPYNHYAGKGCKRCAKNGYRPNKRGILYVLTSEEIVKIGITNRSVTDRLKSVVKSSGKDFKEMFCRHFEDGQIPYDIETALLRELRSKYQQPTEKFDGSTECFYDVDHEWLLSRINELIKEHNASDRSHLPYR